MVVITNFTTSLFKRDVIEQIYDRLSDVVGNRLSYSPGPEIHSEYVV